MKRSYIFVLQFHQLFCETIIGNSKRTKRLISLSIWSKKRKWTMLSTTTPLSKLMRNILKVNSSSNTSVQLKSSKLSTFSQIRIVLVSLMNRNRKLKNQKKPNTPLVKHIHNKSLNSRRTE